MHDEIPVELFENGLTMEELMTYISETDSINRYPNLKLAGLFYFLCVCEECAMLLINDSHLINQLLQTECEGPSALDVVGCFVFSK